MKNVDVVAQPLSSKAYRALLDRSTNLSGYLDCIHLGLLTDLVLNVHEASSAASSAFEAGPVDVIQLKH